MKKQEKIEELQKRLNKVQTEIEALKGFRQTAQSEQFKRGLFAEYSFLKKQLGKLRLSEQAKENERLERRERANQMRSEKNKRTWRYWKSISENYDIPIQTVRKEWKKRKKNLESDVDNLIWRNPSP